MVGTSNQSVPEMAIDSIWAAAGAVEVTLVAISMMILSPFLVGIWGPFFSILTYPLTTGTALSSRGFMRI